MSVARTPSEQQLATLRARIVRFRLHCEDAGLWPASVPAKWMRAHEGGLAAREFLLLFRDVSALMESGQEVLRERRRTENLRYFGGWPPGWCGDIWHVSSMLSNYLREVADDWLAAPCVDWGALRCGAEAEQRPMRLPSIDHAERVNAILADRSWRSHFLFLREDEADQDRWVWDPSSESMKRRLPKIMGTHLDEYRLTEEVAAVLDRNVLRLDEILTYGVKDQDFTSTPEEEPVLVQVGRKPHPLEFGMLVIEERGNGGTWADVAERVTRRCPDKGSLTGEAVRKIYKQALKRLSDAA